MEEPIFKLRLAVSFTTVGNFPHYTKAEYQGDSFTLMFVDGRNDEPFAKATVITPGNNFEVGDKFNVFNNDNSLEHEVVESKEKPVSFSLGKGTNVSI